MCLVIFCVSLFLLLSFFQLVISCHLNENPLRPRILFVLGYILFLTLHLFMYGLLMIKLERTFRRTFVDEVFIRNAKLSYQIFPILTYPLSFTVRWESLCDIPVTCPSVIIQEFYSNVLRIDTSVPHFFSRIRDTHIVVTPNIVSEVLYVPMVAHPDYPSCAHLQTVSKDELSSHFCETPSFWGDRQNTPCSGFTKVLRFLNMVMAFILYPLSHITPLQSLVLDFCYPS